MGETSISGSLICSVRNVFWRSLHDARAAMGRQEGVNLAVHFEDALPAYIVAVAAVEALVNESLVSGYAKLSTGNSPFWELEKDWRERLPLIDKIVIATQLHFGRALRRAEKPLNDMRMLIRVRDELTHYKLKGPLPSNQDPVPDFVKDMVQKEVALSYDKQDPYGYAWPQLLACTEGVRWAHNTACRTAHDVAALVPDEFAEQTDMRMLCQANFAEITDKEVVDALGAGDRG